MADRSERPVKRLRRLSTDDDDAQEADDWAAGAHKGSSPSNAAARPRRGVPAPAARIERTSPEEPRQSIHLTVKAPPSKLRQATSGPARNTIAVNSRERFAGGEIVSGPRGTRNKKVILDDTSEEEDDEEEPELEDDDEEEPEDDDDDMDAEGEDDDVEMEDAPLPPPAPKGRGGARPIKPSINIIPAPPPDVSKIVAKNLAMAANDDDDEELSELDSQEEDDDEEEGGDEDAEGEDDDMEDVERDDLDSDDDTPRSISRSNTPDPTKLTRRQRAIADETDQSGLMFLSNEAQKKKHLTAEEHAMRRAEMARRRKNLSEKRNEEEKMDTINRLLKKQPPKRRGRAAADNGESGMDDEPEIERASPVYVRYTQTVNGSQIAVPDEWLVSPIGAVLANSVPASDPPRPFSGRMVEEVS